jgi:hypothetical protein
MSPYHITLVYTILTMPGKTVEDVYQRWTAAIDAVIALCDAEKGSLLRLHASEVGP